MLITRLKSEEEIRASLSGKVFVVNCFGCREVSFPEKEARELENKLKAEGIVTGVLTTDYICNPDLLTMRVKAHLSEIEAADTVLVFSCGVGMQTLSEMFEDKRVATACDTVRLPGFQGVTPLDVDCGQCGTCFLNLTGGICPITACSKSLVNGPCGGGKNGKCEVDPSMDCGWQRIYNRLKELGRLDVLAKMPVQLHDFSTTEATKACKES